MTTHVNYLGLVIVHWRDVDDGDTLAAPLLKSSIQIVLLMFVSIFE